jgi:hypothetical protein
MDNFGSEFGKLRANIGLHYQDSRAHSSDALERSKTGDHCRSARSFQPHNPVRYIFAKLFDMIFVFENPLIVRHIHTPC